MPDNPLQQSDLGLIMERKYGQRYKTIAGVKTPLGYEGDVQLGNWETITQGVSFQTVTPLLEGEQLMEDGAWIILEPGSATPVQLVKEGTFSEIPLLFNGAKVYCLLVSPDKELFVFCFASSMSGKKVVTSEGWVMSIVSPSTNFHKALTAEWENPLWTQTSLEIIEEGSEFGQSLPPEFWRLRKALMQGIEDSPLIRSVDDSSIESN